MKIGKVVDHGNSYQVNGNISVPKSPRNRHYRMIQEWIAEGNEPEIYHSPEPSAVEAAESTLLVTKDAVLYALERLFQEVAPQSLSDEYKELFSTRSQAWKVLSKKDKD